MDRRSFTLGTLGLAAGLAAPLPVFSQPRAYTGPNVILVRFGGGVRRAETIDEAATWAPFLRHSLAPRGTFIPDLRIDKLEGVNTSHAEGTLNLLTGRYLAYRELSAVSDRLEPTEPTLFEYLRRAYDIPSHQVLLINGEDRPQEEFFTFGAGDHFGIEFRSEMLSLHRYKLYRTAMQLAEGKLPEDQLLKVQEERATLLTQDPRGSTPDPSPEVTAFWARWRQGFGDSGFKNPRGDRLLTELSVRSLADLKPRLMMVNYQDPDYVHWGNASHYTRAIAIIDEGLQRLVAAADADPFYRDNTIFVITPDCGRDTNPLAELPFQHHFNSRSAHETWAVIFGPGIGKGTVDTPVDQSAIAPTIAAAMGFAADRAEGAAIEGAFL
ncbi:MAG TPA: sulfatase-like hydrolase/transferase [Tabrizicola sp.]|nr:sulfatase-like hydrolase/transferase [Tabrizicola sp.]